MMSFLLATPWWRFIYPAHVCSIEWCSGCGALSLRSRVPISALLASLPVLSRGLLLILGLE
jgi:hypothetical protein